MADFILLEGDKAIFWPNFGAAIVLVKPGNLTGSGPATLNGKNVCVDGDEKQVSVPGCLYLAPPYVIPGSGTLKIAALAGDQKAQHTMTGGKPVLLRGSNFTATFEVQSPAKRPAWLGVPSLDPTPQYSGSGMLVTKNRKFQGT